MDIEVLEHIPPYAPYACLSGNNRQIDSATDWPVDMQIDRCRQKYRSRLDRERKRVNKQSYTEDVLKQIRRSVRRVDRPID